MVAYQSWLSRCHELNDAFLQICCEFKLSWHIVVNLWSLSQIARSAEADGNQYKTMRMDFKTMTKPFCRHTLHITSKTNINNDSTCPSIYNTLDTVV